MKVRPEDYQSPCLASSAYLKLGETEKALTCQKRGLEIIEKHLELNPDDARALYLGAGALIALGQPEKGLEWAAKAVEADPGDPGILYNVACTYSTAGQLDKAVDYLGKAIAAGFASKEWIINDGDFDPIREHPRYIALIEGMD